MTPAHAVLALFVVMLVFVPAAAFAIWLTGSRLIGRDPRTRRVVDEDLGALAALDTAGFATTAEIAALSPRERLFVARAGGGRVSGVTAAHREGRAESRAALPADREVPLAAFILVCPACGSSLGNTADVAHYVGSCPSCSRRVSSRRRGSRVTFE